MADLGPPNACSTPEQLAEIEKHWTEKYYTGEQSEEFKIHDSPWLAKCIDKATGGKPNTRWFVPLCEKAPAMKWLADQGHEVVGVELIGKAIEQFFDEQKIPYTKADLSGLEFGTLYQSEDKRITIFKCSIFHVTSELLGGAFDAVWERGSLQAIEQPDRKQYSDIILSLLKPEGRILAETFESYDDGTTSAKSGDHGEYEPSAKSITAADFETLFGERCMIEVLGQERWGDSAENMVVPEGEPCSFINTIRLVTPK